MNIDDRPQPALGRKLGNQAHNLPRSLGVQARGGFIHQQNFRILQQRTGDSHPLALSTRKGVGPFVVEVLQPHPLQQPEGLVHHRLRKLARQAAPEADIAQLAGEHVFHHTEALHQGVFLKDHTHGAPGAAQGHAAQRRDIHAIEEDAAAGGLHQPVDCADECALARAGGPDQGQHLALGNFQAYAFQGEVSSGIPLHEVFNSQHYGFHYRSIPPSICRRS